MRELHVVALSEDGRHVLLATSAKATRGGFRIAIDARLAAAVRGDLPRPGEAEVRDSTLSPKEIQARLRAGESPEQIAREAGVPVARVERFSGPVVSERIRVIDEAQSAHLARARRGSSSLPLGEAVERALTAMPTLRRESVEWTARRERDGDWLVELGFVARARHRVARWRYSPATHQVVALDPASAALGHSDGAPGGSGAGLPPTGRPLPRARGAKRALARAAPAKADAQRAPAKANRATAAQAKAPVARRTPAKAAPAKAPVARRTPAKAAPAKVAPAKAPVARRTPAKAAPAKAPVARKTPAKAAPAKAPVARKTPAKAAPAPRRGLRVVPAVPAQPAAGSAPAAARGRASVPAWADVLLSTSPRGDAD